jgi:protein ImuB
MSFACLYAPTFSLQAAWRNEPEIFARPAAVVDGTPPCLRVIAANEKAHDAGVVIGMTQSAAAEFSAIRRRSEAQEQSAHAALLDCARAFSPRIEDTAIDTVLLDLEGLERLLGPASEVARQALGRAGELGLKIHVAIAANPDTAILAARGFSGITLIPAGEEADRLAKLPIEILDPSSQKLASEGLEILHAWGIHQLKELAALPPVQLSERLGQEGVRWWQLARGGYSRPLMLAQEVERWEETWELEDPVETLDALDFVLSSVLTRLSKRLAVRSLATQELRLKLDLAEGIEPEPSLALEEKSRQKDTNEPSAIKLYERKLRFPMPLCNATLFFKLWRLRLDSDLPPAPVLRVTVAAELARLRPVQGGLFSPLAPDPEKLELTMARIKGIVGNGNVGSPALIDSHKPYTFCMNEFNVPPSLTPVPCQPRRDGTPDAIHSFASLSQPSRSATPAKHRKFRQASIHPLPSPLWGRGEGGEGVPRTFQSRTGSLASGGKKNPISMLSPAPSQSPNYLMALRVFRPFVPAQVEWRSGRPTYLLSSMIRGKIPFAAGPWRNSGDWWNDTSWNLEEWDVEIDVGAYRAGRLHRRKANPVYRLSHDLARDEWYLQGEYD